MKSKHVVFITFFLLLGIALLSDSCKKKSPAPDYPQLIGIYSGTTTQGQEIKISINNIDGILYVTYYKIKVIFISMGPQTYEKYNQEGIASLDGAYFKIPMGTGIYGQGFLDGTINFSTLLLSGTYRIYNQANLNDYSDGFYSASKTQ